MRGVALKGFLGIGWCLGTLVVCALLCGCGAAHRESHEREQSNLRPLAVFYGQSVGATRSTPANSENLWRNRVP